jgi:hypothetical protein
MVGESTVAEQTARVYEFPARPSASEQVAVATGSSVGAGGLGALAAYWWAVPLALGREQLVTVVTVIAIGVTAMMFALFAVRRANETHRSLEAIALKTAQRADASDALVSRLAGSVLGNLVRPALGPNSFELYLQYDRLSAARLGEILQVIDAFYRAVFLLMQEELDETAFREANSAGPVVPAEALMKAHPEAQLNIEFAQTGDSIKFVMRTGWKPTIGTRAGDVEVGLPKGALAAGLAALLLGAVIDRGVATFQGVLSIAIQQQTRELNDLDKTQRELNIGKSRIDIEKGLHELRELQRKANSPSPRQAAALRGAEEGLDKLIKATVMSEDIKAITVTSGLVSS